MATTTNDLTERYRCDGYLSGVDIVTADEAQTHRDRLERIEAHHGSLHYLDKVHMVSASAFELASSPVVLDVVEACIGPNIVLYNSTYIIKEANTAAHVAWHQDLTYWGLSDDDAQVSMWLALSPADAESGCMQMIPGSHRSGRLEHETDSDPDNVLSLKQHLRHVDDRTAELCPLSPGQASFHHGWTVHTSAPNRSDDRRIGLNVQFVAPHNVFVGNTDHGGNSASGILLRGEDTVGFYQPEPQAKVDLDPDTTPGWLAYDAQMKANFTSG